MKLAICVATMRPAPDGTNVRNVTCLNGSTGPGDIPLATTIATALPNVYVKYNTTEENSGVVGSYQKLYEACDADVLCFMHDDVIVRERGWDERILQEFEDTSIGLVGFGGAKWHGEKNLYKVPYLLTDLRRGDYMSNVDDAEVHGKRFQDSADVAVLDGFCLCVRRVLLERAGGWSRIASGCDFYCYDYALCASARRLGYRVRCVGVRCHHRGGGTSVASGEKVVRITGPAAYEASHRWFYESYRDVMPWDVRENGR